MFLPSCGEQGIVYKGISDIRERRNICTTPFLHEQAGSNPSKEQGEKM